jgi:DNA-directed RNA polymerase subunit RPC12/RpoP
MKVSDFEIDFSSGAFSCCMDEVMNNNAKAHEGMVIRCSHCGKRLVLSKSNGKLMWRVVK